MKEIIKSGASLLLKIVIVNIMCFFVVISFNVLATAAFTKNIGYKAYGTTSDSSTQSELYTYYKKDGEDTKKAEYEKQGYTVTESSIRSEMTKGQTAAFLTISQIFCLLILISFIYPNIWHIGTNDSNLVKFKHKTEDKAKGFKIGGIAAVLPFLMWVFLVVAKFGAVSKFPTVLYKFLNTSFYSVIQLITGSAATAGDLSLLQLVLLFLPILFIPAVGGVSYILGYNNFSIGEKLIYKKK